MCIGMQLSLSLQHSRQNRQLHLKQNMAGFQITLLDLPAHNYAEYTYTILEFLELFLLLTIAALKLAYYIATR